MINNKIETLLEPLMERLHLENLLKKLRTFEDAVTHCNKLNIDISNIRFHYDDAPDVVAYNKLKIFVKALNEGWKPDSNNTNQYKYYNYFYINTGAFAYDSTDCDGSYVDVPSALFLKSAELAKHVANVAFEEYKSYYI